MTDRLAGKTALVTGGTSNIGRAIAIAFAAEGARVVGSGRDAQRGAEVMETIRAAGGQAAFLPAVLDGSLAASHSLAERATEHLGGHIDILVNNAGIFPSLATADTDEATFDEVFAVNVKSPFFLVGAIAPAMAAAGGGAIINLGSWVTKLGIPASLYSSSKGAIEALTQAWSAEYGPYGVRVNTISPGVVRTPEPSGDEPDLRDALMKGTPAGRVGTPKSVAYAAVYLASDEAEFVHGAMIDVDGGRTRVTVVQQ
jgi:NAD(P)-dependent dehydrogenase (short-subunit alcohol dehydrogenase family)